MNTITTKVTISDEIFIATAILHRDNPGSIDFKQGQIVEKVRQLFGDDRPGVKVHVSTHCVANIEPNGGRFRVLYDTGKKRRRLLLAGDDVHPDRGNGKIFPSAQDVPHEYRELIEWAKARHSQGGKSEAHPLDALINAHGIGHHLWKGRPVDVDAWVRELREGWD